MVLSIKISLDDRFQCKGLNREVSVSECLDLYVDANSLNIRNRPCYKCPVGLKIRTDFANSP